MSPSITCSFPLVLQATPPIRGKEGLVNARTTSCSAIRSCCIQSDSVILILDVTSFIWWPTKHCVFTCSMAERSRDLNSRLLVALPGRAREGSVCVCQW